jgi:enamine deaminase RidA (YjgF/YER057c/UK114 family)
MSSPHLSPWTEAAPLVFVSGQLPFDPSGRIPHADVAQQTTQALQNLAAIARRQEPDSGERIYR